MSHFTLSMRRRLTLLCMLALLCTLTALPAAAAEREIVYNERYCFSFEDFATSDAAAAPRGILLTSVPEESIGSVYIGARRLRAGDALAASELTSLRFESSCLGDETAGLSWIPVFSSAPAPETSLLIHIGNGKNQPPTAENSTLETYRNISIDGKLTFSDPDDSELEFTVITQPKRGVVSVNRDGSYVYSPAKNKVGKDSFTVQIADSAGNCAEATVHVTIIKPTDKATFADLSRGSDQYVAMWLKEQGIYTGQTLSGTRLFQPEQAVTRGEFLVMAMDLLNIPPADEALSTGFADEEDTPAWLRPYLVTALRSGFISGAASPEGLCFRHDAAVTQAEAAVMLRNMLGLEPDGVVSVFSGDDVPAWAAEAVTCLNSYGIDLLSQPGSPVTMQQAAHLLYQLHSLMQTEQLSASLLGWAADA